MEFEGIVHPEQLAILTEALARYCRSHRINPGTPAYEEAGIRIVAAFESGVGTVDDLLARLDSSERRAS